MYKIYLVIILILVAFMSNGHNIIQPNLVYTSQNQFKFLDQGQYLSVNNSLFDGNKFTRLLNTLVKADTIKSVSRRKRTNGKILTPDKHYEAVKLKATVKISGDLQKNAAQKIDEYLKKKYCIDNNIISSFSKDATPEYVLQLGEKNKKIGELIEVLNSLTKESPKADKLETVTKYNNQMESLIKKIETGFVDICTAEKLLCGCYSG